MINTLIKTLILKQTKRVRRKEKLLNGLIFSLLFEQR
jgi:hypothetical protein